MLITGKVCLESKIDQWESSCVPIFLFILASSPDREYVMGG